MRQLTVKQKKLLEKEVVDYFSKYGGFPSALDELDNVDKIDMLNPCELFYQNANRFVDDMRWNTKYDYMFRR